MHELSIVTEIRRISRAAVAGEGEGRLEEVVVAVGELSGVEPELLLRAWEALTADGPDAGSLLRIDWRRARQHCPDCRASKDRAEGTWLRVCPDCGAPLHVEGGMDLDVLRVTFDVAEATGSRTT